MYSTKHITGREGGREGKGKEEAGIQIQKGEDGAFTLVSAAGFYDRIRVETRSFNLRDPSARIDHIELFTMK